MGLGRRSSVWLIAVLLVSAGVSAVPSRAQSAPDDPGFEFQWALEQIGVQDAWAIGRGRGASVAVLDTGVDLVHEDLEGRLAAGGRDFTNDDASPQDDNGQGTHIAGIVAASTDNGIGVAGVAHAAQVLPVKVLDDEDEGFEIHVIEGIRFAIEKKVDVLLLDLDKDIVLADGGFRFEEAIVDAWNAGVVPVISAEHPFVRSSQFSDAPALVVGAVTRQGNASGDNDGVGSAKWGMAAPGGAGTASEDDVFSTFLPGSRPNGVGGTREYGRYVYDAGNIQAAAHVAGVAAILRGLGQTPQQTVDRLLSGANDAGVAGRDRVYGAGLLHAGKSVRGLPPDRAGSANSGTPTTASAEGTPAAGSQPGTSPGSVGPPASGTPGGTDPPPASAGQPTPTEPAAAPGADAPAEGESAEGGDAVAEFAANDSKKMPGRTPLLPLVAFLLLVGSGTIAWALRRRTLDAAPPINS